MMSIVRRWGLFAGLLCIQSVWLFSPAGAQEVPEFVLQNGHSDLVYSVAFSPDGLTLASGSADETVKVWDVSTGRLIRTLEGRSRPSSVVFSPDGQTLAAGCEDETVKVWDVGTGKLIRTLEGHSSSVFSVAFSPDGQTLASGSEDTTIKVWDVGTGKLIRTLEGHSNSSFSVAFSPDSQTLASGSMDSTIRIWEMGTGKLLRTLEGHSPVAFSPDGLTLASGSEDETIKVWEVGTGRLIRTLEGDGPLAFSPDGLTLASGSEDETIKVWDVGTGRLIRTLQHSVFSIPSVTFAFSPDSQSLVSAGDETIKIWRVGTGKLVRTLEGHTSFVTSVAFSPDGQTLAAGSWDTTTKVWEVGTGKLIRTLEGHTSFVFSVAFSPDGQTLASAGDETVKVWEVSTGKLVRTLEGHTSTVFSVAFSPDGQNLASGSWDFTVKVWEVGTGTLVRTLEGHRGPIYHVAFSPDGRTLASEGSDETVKVWEVDTGRLLRSLEGRGPVAFSPDGQTLACEGSDFRSIKVWEVRTGRLVRMFKGHGSFILSMAFSPDGTTLASGSGDQTIKVWEVATGKLVQTLNGHSTAVASVAFSPDGQTLASGGNDTSLRQWRMPGGDPLAISYAFNREDYLTYTPEGIYVASEGGEKLAAWRIDGEIYGFEQYAERFHRPDLVARRLAGLAIEIPGGVRLAIDRPPSLHWRNPFKTTNSARVRLQITYEGDAELDHLFVVFNNEPLAVETLQDKRVTIEIPLQLIARHNRLVAFVTDRKRLKSKPLTAKFEYLDGAKGPGSPIRPAAPRALGNYGKKYAIIVGISDYAHLPPQTENGGLADLRFANRDALAFEAFLRDTSLSGGGWQIQLLLEDDATEVRLDDALTKTLLHANRRDLIVTFFSGHARSHPLRPKDVYLLTEDFQPEDPRSGFSYSLLLDLIRDTKAGHTLTFIDACRSGTVGFKGPGGQQATLDSDLLGERIGEMRENHVVFASASGTQPSWEDEDLEHGVFSYYLLEGLRGKAPEEKFEGFVDLGELQKYVTNKVLEHTENHPDFSPQRPQLFERDGIVDEDLPIAIRQHR